MRPAEPMINCSVRAEEQVWWAEDEEGLNRGEGELEREWKLRCSLKSLGSLNRGLVGLGKAKPQPTVAPAAVVHAGASVRVCKLSLLVLFPLSPLCRLSSVQSICRAEWAMQCGMKLLIGWMIGCVHVGCLITILQYNGDRMVNWIYLSRQIRMAEV